MEHTVRGRVGTGAAVLAACAALAACGTGSSTGSSAAGTASSSAPSSSAPAVTTTAAPTTTTPAPSPTSTTTTKKPAATTTPAAATVTLVLEPDGLGYLTGSASVRHLPFGTDAATVRTVVGKALGGKLTNNDLPECGQGPRSSAGRAGFSVLLDGTKFVGWTDQGAKGRTLTTLDGLGIGSTYAQVKASLPGVTAADGSLGPEFTDAGGLGGILDGMSPKSKVTLVYAGETCFFR